MAFLRRTIDAVNGEIQFEIIESCSSVNLKFNPEFGNDKINNLKVRVERISKNTANQLLYSGVYSEIKSLLKFAFVSMGNVLPFAIGKSVELSEDVKILVTLQFPPDSGVIVDGKLNGAVTTPASFEYELNTTIQTTKNPLIIKKIAVDEELTIDTEFYPVLLASKDLQSYETVIIVQNELGNDIPKKVFYGREMLKSQLTQEDSEFVTMVTQPNQKITLKGTSTNYLVLLQA